ncbi:MAG: DNA polymerase ligase N-terminal domain-containing protein [Chitinophagaceae bacterium]
MPLTLYNKKRNFKNTPEPKGTAAGKKSFRFVVQRHDATRLHYDFRLELGGVLKSWAVPKGPSMNVADKRLAVMVEDHPVSYFNFEGEIPEGNYGAGTVEIWDKGVFYPVNEEVEKISEKQALTNLKKGELKIFLKGKRLEGGFVLVRLHNDEKNWLLIKHKDEFAVTKKYDSEKFVKKMPKKTSRAGTTKSVKMKTIK